MRSAAAHSHSHGVRGCAIVGTSSSRSNGRQLIHFRTGAFVAGEPIFPIAISYPARRYSATCGSVSRMTHFFRLCCQFVTYADVVFLPPFVPDADMRADPRLYADAVRSLMARTLSVPCVEATQRDKIAYLLSIGKDAPTS